MEYDIRPKGKLNLGIRELWEYRELFFFFTWRDIKVKYKQTLLGVAWIMLQPAMMTVLFVLFFKGMVQPRGIAIPYEIFVMSGLVIWTMFASALSNAGNSMVSNANIIKKIYFPRLIIPISAVLTALFDMLFGIIVLLIAMPFFDVSFNIMALAYWPLAMMAAALAALGLGTLLAALNVKYRDFRYIIPFLIQMMLFITPVIYPLTVNGHKTVEALLRFNPVTAPVELFRAGFAGYEANWYAIGISISVSIVLFTAGLFYFRKTESYFADIA